MARPDGARDAAYQRSLVDRALPLVTSRLKLHVCFPHCGHSDFPRSETYSWDRRLGGLLPFSGPIVIQVELNVACDG